MSRLTKIVNTIILTGAIGLSDIIGQPNQIYGEGGAKEKTEKGQVKVPNYEKHDHSKKFYEFFFNSKSISVLESELNRHPNNKGYIRLCELLFEIQKYDQAALSARKAIQLNAKDWEGYASLGACLGVVGNHEKAWQQLEKAKQIDPNHPEIFLCFGEIENRRGNLRSAVTYFNKALKIDPSYKPALDYRQEIISRISR